MPATAPVGLVPVQVAVSHVLNQRVRGEVERIRLNAIISRQNEEIARLKHALANAPTEANLAKLQHEQGFFRDEAVSYVDVAMQADGPCVDQETVLIDVEGTTLVPESFTAIKQGESFGSVKLRFSRAKVIYQVTAVD